jgi:aminopeptidase
VPVDDEKPRRTGAPPARSIPPGSSRLSRPPSMRPLFAPTRLSEIDFDLVNASRRIVESALGLVPGERLLLITDRVRKDVALEIEEATRNIGATAVIVELEDFGERPLRRLPEAIRKEAESSQATLLLVGSDDGELGMREDLLGLVKALNLRHGNMLGITRRSMTAGFTVDPSRILDATRAVRQRMRSDSKLRLRTAAGSDLEVRIGSFRRWVEWVGVVRRGRWEDLPSGQLITAPADVNGIFVADASLGGFMGASAGLLDRHPVRVEIEGGLCKSVRSTDLTLQRSVEEFLRREHHLDRVGHITLGTNVGILQPIGELSCDQNLPGLHLCFGSTLSEHTGGTVATRSQLAMTCAGADVDLDGSALMRSGRYMVV